MKKFLTVLIALLSAFLLTATLAACTKTQPANKKYTLFFIDEGETVFTIDTAGNEILSLPEGAETDGYTFVGWFFDQGEWKIRLTEDYYENKPLTENTSVYARRIRNDSASEEYEIEFMTNGGSSVQNVVTNLIEREPETTRTHFRFDGWYSSADFKEGTKIAFPYSPTENTTLYAKWTQTEFYIAFEENGGSSLSDGYFSEIQTSPETTRTHFRFDGWYSSADFRENTKIAFPYSPTENTTLYAKWTQTEFYIAFEENDGSSVSDGWFSVINSAPFTERAGFDFTGWYTDGSLSENSLLSYPFSPKNDMTLFAGWKKTVEPALLSIDGFKIEGTSVAKLSPLGGDTAEFDFEQQNVTVSESAQWTIYKDADCTQPYTDNIVPVVLGNNVFYLKVSIGEKSKVYTVTIEKVDGYALDIYENRTYVKTVYANKGDTWQTPVPEYDETLYDFDGEYFADENMTVPFSDFRATENKSVYLKIYYIGLKFYPTSNTVSGMINTDDTLIFLKIPSEIDNTPVYSVNSIVQYNNYLEEILIEKGITYIGRNACIQNKNLKKVTLPDGVKLEGGAFSKCELLSEIVAQGALYSTDTAFGDTKFYRTEENWENGALYIGSYLAEYDYKKATATSYTVKSGTLSISGNAFRNAQFSNLTSVDLGNTVTYIGNWAFKNVTTLKTITGINALCDLGYEIFDDTAYYNDQNNWDNGIFYIGKCLVEVSSAAGEEVSIKDGTEFIVPYAFTEATSVKTVKFPSSLQTIGDYAFYKCTWITKIEFAEGLKNIRQSAFSGCTGLGDILLPASVNSIDIYALSIGKDNRIFLQRPLSEISAAAQWNGYWTVYYEFSESEPAGEGNYWHYGDDQSIQIW